MISIVFRNDDFVRWGAGAGRPLTSTEVDLNFWNLKVAVETLETAMPAAAAGIDYFEIVGTEFYVHLTDHTVIGPYTLPTITWNFRGNWAASTAYVVGDVVSINYSVYLVLVAHTSTAPFDANATDGLGHNLYGLLFTSPVPKYTPSVTKTVTGTTYTLLATDANCYIRCTNAAGCTITVPPAGTLLATQDDEWNFRAAGGANCFLTFTEGSGVTIDPGSIFIKGTDTPGATVTLKMVSANNFDLMGLLGSA